jgi:hypothetical protein
MALQREQSVTDAQGARIAVLIPIRDYERLLEDLHDLAVMAERWAGSGSRWRS